MTDKKNTFDLALLSPIIEKDVERALQEDVGEGDLTAALVPLNEKRHAAVISRENAVICGQPWVDAVIRKVDQSIEWKWHLAEGQPCQADQTILSLSGKARSLLTLERTALNFLQTLSAVATKTAQFVQEVKDTQTVIVDTRKTLPGLRGAQKYAVTQGGGVNHRWGLYDAILIKENHIEASGGVKQALQQADQWVAHLEKEKKAMPQFIQIEVETLSQLQEALEAGAKMILLDNMSIDTLKEAVRLNAKRAILEVSGGVGLDNVRQCALAGIDRISIGALTKDIKAIDFSMRFNAAPFSRT